MQELIMKLDRFASRLGIFTSLAVLLAMSAFTRAQETLPPNAKVVRLEARPDAIALKTQFEYAQLLLSAQLESGEKVDGTRLAKIEKPANLVEVSASGLVRPKADGAGEIKCSLEGQEVKIPVKVAGLKEK